MAAPTNYTDQERSDFDPLTQSIELLTREGEAVPVSLPDMQEYIYYGIRVCINYSSQLAASLVLLVMLLILTKKEKRRSSVFVLNALSLAINAIRSLLQCLYFTGPFFHVYAAFTGDFFYIQDRDVATSVAAGVMTLLLVICIEASLALQVQVVLVTAPEAQRFWIMLSALTVAMIAVAFRFALTIVNAQYILRVEEFSEWYWLAKANNVTLTISIFFFSAIFVGKLAYAIVRRRRLGLKQFGPMQVIFIMGCQTLVVPALFAGLQHIGTIVEFASLVLTVVAISLPLSALWAATAIDGGDTPAQLQPAVEKKSLTDSSGSRTLNGSDHGDEEKALGKGAARMRDLSSLHSPDALEGSAKSGQDYNAK